jgi:pyruvate/2-oxoglutarate dehydrogenase complex dihydrolipoamide dehydrogenase (E3) component
MHAMPTTPGHLGRRPELRASELHADLCIIGAGSGGLSVASGAVQMGASVTLIEKHRMGGDCLNTGGVPSKALLSAAHAADVVRQSGRFGDKGHEPTLDVARVHAHVHGVIGAIAPHDSVERFAGLGVTVIQAAARFTGPREVKAGGQGIRARRVVIATGSSAARPPIPGLAQTPQLTNERVFDLTDRPDHLAALGGGPIGIEMAQAFRRLGTAVTMLERATILPKDEPEAVAILRDRLRAEGIVRREGAQILATPAAAHGVEMAFAGGEGLAASHLPVAAGRSPAIQGSGSRRRASPRRRAASPEMRGCAARPATSMRSATSPGNRSARMSPTATPAS